MRGRILKKIMDAVDLLSQPTGTTISSLCEKLDIEKRQAHRVIETLKLEWGFVIEPDKPNLGRPVRYYLDKEYCKRLWDMKLPGRFRANDPIIFR